MEQSNDRTQSAMLTSLLFLAKVSVIAISVLMIGVTLLQVIFRYVLAASLPWSEELARYCFVWIVFLGAAIGLDRGFHLGVDLFVNLLPEKIRTGLDILCSALIACFSIAVTYASFPVISMNLLQRSPALGVQMTWIYVAIPTSMILIFFISIARIAKTLREQAGQNT
jgi:C4-dicarboxylate transporter DctQ subunit